MRVIATTNRHLEQSVEKKEFRQDLFFRLNVVPIWVAPLRERRDDILFLAEHFMKRFARKHGGRAQQISAACQAALLDHDWPGNIRELQNVIERSVILTGDEEELTVESLGFTPTATDSPAPALTRMTASEPVPESKSAFLSLADLERQHILAALEQCKGNRTHAAKLLNISIRTLRNKFNEYKEAGFLPVTVNDSDEPEE